MKYLFITMGDPRGIGPQIILRSLELLMQDLKSFNIIPVVVGDHNIISQESQNLNLKIFPYANDSSECKIYYKEIKSVNHPGRDALNYIDKGLELCCNNSLSALVTAPVEKKIIAEISDGFIGHTEYLAEKCGVENFAMSFVSEKIKMSLLTTHIPLKEVSGAIKKSLVEKHIRLVDKTLRELFAIRNPKIIIASINPHAGEAGLLGNEEEKEIRPIVSKLFEEGVLISGPVAANEALTRTLKGEYDYIISTYHDQLLTPVKIFLGPTVNLTLGLPIIRTSPDHGPALDISHDSAEVDSSSMYMALKVAMDLLVCRKN